MSKRVLKVGDIVFHNRRFMEIKKLTENGGASMYLLDSDGRNKPFYRVVNDGKYVIRHVRDKNTLD